AAVGAATPGLGRGALVGPRSVGVRSVGLLGGGGRYLGGGCLVSGGFGLGLGGFGLAGRGLGFGLAVGFRGRFGPGRLRRRLRLRGLFCGRGGLRLGRFGLGPRGLGLFGLGRFGLSGFPWLVVQAGDQGG